jgi:hypothetical protein
MYIMLRFSLHTLTYLQPWPEQTPKSTKGNAFLSHGINSTTLKWFLMLNYLYHQQSDHIV